MSIPHNEQKYNNNQLSLQHIGNLACHQSKSIASFDDINSLTTPNNHYTLLYPSLVQEILNFSLHNSNSVKNNASFLRNINVNNTKYSSLDSSLSPRDILFFLQILSLYQLELSKGNTSITYSSLKLAKLLGADASCDTGSLSGDANMRATILRMTAKLESLGFLKVFRKKRNNGMDKANKLIPMLPDRMHARIKDSASNLKVSDSSKLDHESNLDHILRTKLFVPIELEFLKNLFQDNMPAKYKLFFLNCIMSAYRNFRKNNNSSLSFSTTSRELIKHTNISKRSLFNIFRYIKQQGNNFFLKVEHKYTKSDDIDSNRYDKSIFVISIDPLVFPISHVQQLQKEENSNISYDELQSADTVFLPDTYKGFETGVQKKQPSSAKKTALNNKDIIIENKYIKNIDESLDGKNKPLDKLAKNNQIKPQTFLHTSNSKHLESEICLLSSKSFFVLPDIVNSSTIAKNKFVDPSQNIISGPNNLTNHLLENETSSFSSKFFNNLIKGFKQNAQPSISRKSIYCINRTIKDISEKASKEVLLQCWTSNREESITTEGIGAIQEKVSRLKRYDPNSKLKDYYPLSKGEVSSINWDSRREFSVNFANQLMLKLIAEQSAAENSFPTRDHMKKYMIKAFKYELHQSPKVNHESFRLSCNLTDDDRVKGNQGADNRTIEKYLARIENSYETSYQMQLRRKMVGIFAKIKAYEILVNSYFSYFNDVFSLRFTKEVDLSIFEEERLKMAIQAVYGHEVKIKLIKANVSSNDKIKDYAAIGKSKENAAVIKYSRDHVRKYQNNNEQVRAISSSSAKKLYEPLSGMDKNNICYKIRQGLIEEIGLEMDKVWFSAVRIQENKDKQILELIAPSKFYEYWIRNNYNHIVSRLSANLGFRMVEYSYKKIAYKKI